jgi:hypothetical protein
LRRPNYRSYGEFVTSFSSSNAPSATRVKALQARQRVRPKAISRPHSGKSRKHKVESRNWPSKPPKATLKPYSRHILGIDSGVQSHPKATPRLHQGSTKATLQPPQSHPKATLMRPSSHLQARCKPASELLRSWN